MHESLPARAPQQNDRALQQYVPAPSYGAPEPERAAPWGRMIDALWRYKWIIVGMVVLGGFAGLGLARLVTPSYDAFATIWVSAESSQNAQAGGPFRGRELMEASSYPELLRSFRILDRVSHKVPLFVQATTPTDPATFRTAEPTDRIRPGNYMLSIDKDGKYRLELQDDQRGRRYAFSAKPILVERGQLGDSIGRAVGLRWKPDTTIVRREQQLGFRLMGPRAASIMLRDRLVPNLPRESRLMRLTLSGTDPALTARTLNVLVHEFVTTASELKKQNLVDVTRTLREQLDYAATELSSAERALESFKIQTITLPTEGAPVAAGLQETRDPVFSAFFEKKISHDNIKRDRESLARTMAAIQAGELSINALWSHPAVTEDARDLRAALTEYSNAESRLRTLQAVYTDEFQGVRQAQQTLAALRTSTIPREVASLLEQLRRREQDLQSEIGSASAELQQIPSRTIEELRLERNVDARVNLHTTLKNRYEEARLAEARAMPDLTILDTAVTPTFPSRNTAPKLLMLSVLGSLGAGVGLALLLGKLDRRFRYPEEASRDLGLAIVGAVPTVSTSRRESVQLQQAAHLTEAFRSMRFSLASGLGGNGGPVMVTITSPSAGDGKSFVSANLALAFAESGARTVLVDGDVRRGSLHSIFNTESKPGLVDVLTGAATLDSVLRPTTHANLTLVPTGTRSRRSPEWLASAFLPATISALAQQYDVVIVDSAPLSAGADSFALAMSTQNLLMVLRAGKTDRKLADAKLQMLDRLPVRVVGTVINAVEDAGTYKYYGYDSYDYYSSGDAGEDTSLQGRFRRLVGKA
jgi:capsular exopolysaccharide synthesis family protein